MIDPPPAAARCGIPYLQLQNTLPVSALRRIRFHSSVVTSTSGLMLLPTSTVGAALLTSVVSDPNRSTTWSITQATLCFLGDVEREERRLAAFGGDEVDHLLTALDRAARDRDLGALAREHLRDRAADAAGGTRDERDLAFESHSPVLSSGTRSHGVSYCAARARLHPVDPLGVDDLPERAAIGRGRTAAVAERDDGVRERRPPARPRRPAASATASTARLLSSDASRWQAGQAAARSRARSRQLVVGLDREHEADLAAPGRRRSAHR